MAVFARLNLYISNRTGLAAAASSRSLHARALALSRVSLSKAVDICY